MEITSDELSIKLVKTLTGFQWLYKLSDKWFLDFELDRIVVNFGRW